MKTSILKIPLVYNEQVTRDNNALCQHLRQNRKDPKCRFMYAMSQTGQHFIY